MEEKIIKTYKQLEKLKDEEDKKTIIETIKNNAMMITGYLVAFHIKEVALNLKGKHTTYKVIVNGKFMEDIIDNNKG